MENILLHITRDVRNKEGEFEIIAPISENFEKALGLLQYAFSQLWPRSWQNHRDCPALPNHRFYTYYDPTCTLSALLGTCDHDW